jgi:hypothetical protein
MSACRTEFVPEYEIFDHRPPHRPAPPPRQARAAGRRARARRLRAGRTGGHRAPSTALVAFTHALRDLPEGTTFSATGIGRTTLPVLMASLAAGGHLRVGMEDTVTYAKASPSRATPNWWRGRRRSPGWPSAHRCAGGRPYPPGADMSDHYAGGELIAELVRSGFLESRHHGSVVVLDAAARSWPGPVT